MHSCFEGKQGQARAARSLNRREATAHDPMLLGLLLIHISKLSRKTKLGLTSDQRPLAIPVDAQGPTA